MVATKNLKMYTTGPEASTGRPPFWAPASVRSSYRCQFSCPGSASGSGATATRARPERTLTDKSQARAHHVLRCIHPPLISGLPILPDLASRRHVIGTCHDASTPPWSHQSMARRAEGLCVVWRQARRLSGRLRLHAVGCPEDAAGAGLDAQRLHALGNLEARRVE